MQSNRVYALVLEDNEFEAETMVFRIEELGAIGLIAGNFDEAYEVANLVRLDIVLIDINLGGELTGMQVVQKLKEELSTEVFQPQLVILTSMDLSELEKKELVSMGVERVLNKPMRKVDLHATIEALKLNKQPKPVAAAGRGQHTAGQTLH